MKYKFNKQIYTTAIFALALAFILAQPHMAVGFVFVVLAIVIGLPFWLYKAYRVPAKRSIFLINTIIWIVLFSTVIIVHLWRADSVRRHADMIVIKIEEYRQQTGHYPESLDKVNVSREQLKGTVGMAGYFVSETKIPAFFMRLRGFPLIPMIMILRRGNGGIEPIKRCQIQLFFNRHKTGNKN